MGGLRLCHHDAVVNVDRFSDEVPTPAIEAIAVL
jgi:hypothetical protein